MKCLCKVCSTILFSGFSPIAPGTVGSFIALVLYFITPHLAPGYWLLIILLLTAIGIYVATQAEEIYGHDASQITIDEFVGMLVSVFALPKLISVSLAAFFLFRFFDILKPLLINKVQSFPKGWGIMADDLLAGIYTNILLQIVIVIFGIR